MHRPTRAHAHRQPVSSTGACVGQHMHRHTDKTPEQATLRGLHPYVEGSFWSGSPVCCLKSRQERLLWHNDIHRGASQALCASLIWRGPMPRCPENCPCSDRSPPKCLLKNQQPDSSRERGCEPSASSPACSWDLHCLSCSQTSFKGRAKMESLRAHAKRPCWMNLRKQVSGLNVASHKTRHPEG